MNANFGYEHESVVSSINFHPRENILMTSGLDRKVKLFDVSHSQSVLQSEGTYNNMKSSSKSKKIQSIFLPDLPVYSANFIQDGKQAIFTGNRKHFYVYDLARNKLEKNTIGTLDQKNLSLVTVSKYAGSDFMCIASPE